MRGELLGVHPLLNDFCIFVGQDGEKIVMVREMEMVRQMEIGREKMREEYGDSRGKMEKRIKRKLKYIF